MKNYLLLFAVFALSLIGAYAQNSVTVTNYVTITNTVETSTNVASLDTNAPDFNKYDITFSSAGSSYGRDNQVGIDVSFSIDPFEKLPDLWVGVSQSLYWSPTFGGSTDFDVDYNFQIWDNLYVQGGWSVGDVYGAGVNNLVRTGPEVIVQYYLSTDTYLYGAVNYDMITKEGGGDCQFFNHDNNGTRWSLGLGVEF